MVQRGVGEGWCYVESCHLGASEVGSRHLPFLLELSLGQADCQFHCSVDLSRIERGIFPDAAVVLPPDLMSHDGNLGRCRGGRYHTRHQDLAHGSRANNGDGVRDLGGVIGRRWWRRDADRMGDPTERLLWRGEGIDLHGGLSRGVVIDRSDDTVVANAKRHGERFNPKDKVPGNVGRESFKWQFASSSSLKCAESKPC